MDLVHVGSSRFGLATYKKVYLNFKGVPLTDSLVDGSLYKKKGRDYFEKIFSSSEINAFEFGVIGDGVFDDSKPLQLAIDYCAQNNKVLVIDKTKEFYLLKCNLLKGDESTAMEATVKVALLMRSNLKIKSNQAVLKIADNVSSLSDPQQMRMFFSNDFLENISFDGLVLDSNGQNNLISPNLPSHSNNFTQSQIIFSGTKSGIAAGANNVEIKNCTFLNNAGVSCVCMAQSNVHDVVLGSGWSLLNNRFFNNGFGSSDHSSVFGWANDVKVYDNYFDNVDSYNSVGKFGGLVAYEVHGSNHDIRNNLINNYYQGFWISLNYSQSFISNTIISNNIANVSCMFVDVYNGNLEVAPFYPIDIVDTFITDNKVRMLNNSVADELKQCMRIASKIHPINFNISSNQFTVDSGQNKDVSFLTVVSLLDQNKGIECLTINNNFGSGLTNGSVFYFGSTLNFKNVSILDNQFTGLNSFYKDVLAYGTKEAQIENFNLSGVSSVQTDNNDRFIAVGSFVASPPLQLVNLALNDGLLDYKSVNTGDKLNIFVRLVVGGNTSITGNVTFKINGLSSKFTNVGSGMVTVGGVDTFVIPRVDATGSWVTLFKLDGTVFNTTTLVAGSVLVFTIDIYHNGLKF